MEYPFKTVFVVDGIVVNAITQYQPGGYASGPDGSIAYIVPVDSSITVGWKCIIDDTYDPPEIIWRKPA